MDQLDDGPLPAPASPATLSRRGRAWAISACGWAVVAALVYLLVPGIWAGYIVYGCAAGNMATSILAESLIR